VRHRLLSRVLRAILGSHRALSSGSDRSRGIRPPQAERALGLEEERMVMESYTFCPHCRLVTLLTESEEGDVRLVRCAGCGGAMEMRLVGAAVGPRQPATILLIDDDRLLLGMFSDALEAEGYRTRMATDGASGIEAAREGRPDLIVLDVVMPGMNGIEVCRRLRAEPTLQQTPIIILTALRDHGLEAEGRAAGATFTMRKPFGTPLILSVIHEILGRKIEAKPRF
jgi:CheY-like chemotaxis protein